MRNRLFEIIEVSKNNDKISSIYDVLMMISIIISILPLAFKQSFTIFGITDRVTTILFILDYLFRLITADYRLNRKGASAFIIYPFTPWAIIDLVSILPSLSILSSSFKLLRLFRYLELFVCSRHSDIVRMLL